MSSSVEEDVEVMLATWQSTGPDSVVIMACTDGSYIDTIKIYIWEHYRYLGGVA